jgi:hypothetical protein
MPEKKYIRVRRRSRLGVRIDMTRVSIVEAGGVWIAVQRV